MKPYRILTRLGRLRRMRKLAEKALAIYQMDEAELRFLRYFANITYRVDLPGVARHAGPVSPYLNGRYLLRILNADNWDYAQGEMIWLAALSGEAGLAVPAPVATPQGELLVRVSTPGIPAGRIVSLMRWLDGRKPGKALSLAQFKAWGAMVARLHAFAERWQPPEGFQRYVWDWEGLLGGRDFDCSVAELVEAMPQHLQEPYQVISSRAREVMEGIGKSAQMYGMVHGDMYAENILIQKDQVIPIDFEDCGFGYYLWDIAVALEVEPWGENWYRQRDAFLEGYTQVRTLAEAQLRHLDLFAAVNYATVVLWGTLFLRTDPARAVEHQAWRDENAARMLRYFERSVGK
jgi:Ser/Thr protein kinase RdoA (MazF antagonist)